MSRIETNSAVIYERVSTARQANENNSLATQLQTTQEHCKRNGWHVVCQFDDPGESGRSLERPAFQSMMDFCKRNRIKYVVVYDLSRFARNATDQGKAIAELGKRGTLVRSVSEPNVDETAAGKFAATVIAASNELFSNSLSERTQERMQIAHECGRYLRTAPVGYENVRRAPRGQPNIIPNCKEAPLVLKAFQLVEAGNDRPSEVLRIMTAHGLRSKKGRQLTLHSFLNMLRNPVYIGQNRSKKHGTVKGLWEPIVDERTFRNVQLILKGKKPTAAPYSRNREDFPLRRFLQCSECGTPLTGAPSRGENGNRYGYYRCYKCHAVNMRTEKAATEFKAMLSRLRPSADLIAKFPQVLEQEWERRSGDSTAMVRRLTAELREKMHSQEKLVLAHLNGDKSIQSVYERMNTKFDEEIEQLRSQIADAEMETATFAELLEFSTSLLVDISTAWERGDITQKQKVQNSLFPSGLKYHPENGILNSESDCLFNQLEGFVTGKLQMAGPERFELPTY